MHERACEYCLATFAAKRPHARFCSDKHRAAWNKRIHKAVVDEAAMLTLPREWAGAMVEVRRV